MHFGCCVSWIDQRMTAFWSLITVRALSSHRLHKLFAIGRSYANYNHVCLLISACNRNQDHTIYTATGRPTSTHVAFILTHIALQRACDFGPYHNPAAQKNTRNLKLQLDYNRIILLFLSSLHVLPSAQLNGDDQNRLAATCHSRKLSARHYLMLAIVSCEEIMRMARGCL